MLFVGGDVAFDVVFVVVFVEGVASDESFASGDGKCGWDIGVDFYGESSSGEERKKR
jgi:hypothetical protein